jgi:hypothetical protein
MYDKNSTSDLTTIKIGTRVRHSSDGATGRIVWANATTVKIQWDDGEKVTWKRARSARQGARGSERRFGAGADRC